MVKQKKSPKTHMGLFKTNFPENSGSSRCPRLIAALFSVFRIRSSPHHVVDSGISHLIFLGDFVIGFALCDLGNVQLRLSFRSHHVPPCPFWALKQALLPAGTIHRRFYTRIKLKLRQFLWTLG